MIRNINFNSNYIKYINEGRRNITFHVPEPYRAIISFLQVENGIVIVLGLTEESSLEQRRRNVINIDEEGKILWVVKDKIHAWQKKFPSVSKEFLDSEKGACFSRIYMENEKIILRDGGGALFFLDPATGSIEHWKTERW